MDKSTSNVGVKVTLFMSLAALLAVVAVPLVAEQRWEPMHLEAMSAARDDPLGYQSAERDGSAHSASRDALAQRDDPPISRHYSAH